MRHGPFRTYAAALILAAALSSHKAVSGWKAAQFSSVAVININNFKDSSSYVFAVYLRGHYDAYGLSSLRVEATSLRSTTSLLDSMNIIAHRATSVKSRAANRRCRFDTSCLRRTLMCSCTSPKIQSFQSISPHIEENTEARA